MATEPITDPTAAVDSYIDDVARPNWGNMIPVDNVRLLAVRVATERTNGVSPADVEPVLRDYVRRGRLVKRGLRTGAYFAIVDPT